MDRKVYYGEYTLKYWIELLLKKDLELPDYQRNFVWTEGQVTEFINGLKDDIFVPPVTIGVCNREESHNLILDGQQRLSSLLLAYFGVYPKKDVFTRTGDDALPMADGSAEDEDGEPDVEYVNWSLREFVSKGPREIDVSKSITEKQYNRVDFGVDDGFFENKYLPFSFIIPAVESEEKQHEFYSTVFRNMNIMGTVLSPMESRQSLYFLKTEFEQFFNPECCKQLKIELVGKKQAYDFARTMSLLSQYKKDGRCNKLAQGYRSKMEKYYEEYIYTVVKDKEDGMFAQFSSIFPNKDFAPRIEKLNNALQRLEYKKIRFTSIIDADIYMFGLVYFTVIEGLDIEYGRKDELLRSLHNKIEKLKDDKHKAAPSMLKFIRTRVEESLKIFRSHVIHPTA